MTRSPSQRNSLLRTLSLQSQRLAAHWLITPFSPYILSRFHLSREVPLYGLEGFNRRSRCLSSAAEAVADGDWLFCDTDLVPRFVEEVLPRIRARFVLFTGKWMLPPVAFDRATATLLADPRLILWFGHNLCFDHPRCRPFPYGISHTWAFHVLRRMLLPAPRRRQAVYVGHLGIHAHLVGRPRQARQALAPLMGPKLPLRAYFHELRSHRYVAAPAGDRPDTFRLWEAIAFGALPITELPAPFHPLLAGSALLLDRMEDLLDLDPQDLPRHGPDRRLVLLAHWRRWVISQLAQSGGPPS